MNNRREGYYWVKYKGEWEINYYEKGPHLSGWLSHKRSDFAALWLDCIYDEIDENPIERSNNTLSTVNKSREWIFTFGSDHKHPGGYVKIYGEYAGAREEMFRLYGNKWAFQYESMEAAGVERFKLYEVLYDGPDRVITDKDV